MMSNYLVRVTLLAFAIFLGGCLGMQLVVPPGYASPLWPPAGIAIACLLIMGRQFWPGVLLGAIGSQFYAAIQFSGHLNFNGICSALLIALGSTLQALLAIHLSAKWVVRGVPTLDTPRQVLLFSALTGPVSSLTAASIGVASLVGLQMLPAAEAGLSWFNWWIGDTLGALLITPLLLCLGATPKKLWQPRQFSVAIPLLMTLVVISVIFTGVYNSEKNRTQIEFDGKAASINRLLVDSTHHIIDNTLSLADLFNASTQIDRSAFAQFTQSIRQRHPEIQALEWLPKVKHDDLQAFEQRVHAEGFSDFRVKERDSHGQLQTVSPRDYYFPILYVEPLADNLIVLGLDSASQPQSWHSKLIAIASGKPSASQLIKLIQRPVEKSGLLVSIPLFPDNNPNLSIEALKGFVTLVIQPSRIMEETLQGIDVVGLGIDLTDIDANQHSVELYTRPLLHPINPSYGLKPWRAEFWFCDRLWQLNITADKEFLVEHGSTMTWITLIGGLFLLA